MALKYTSHQGNVAYKIQSCLNLLSGRTSCVVSTLPLETV